VKPGKYQMLGEDPKPYFYRCRLQDYDTSATLVIRTQGDSVPVLTAVRREVHQLDSRITLVGVETLDQHMQLPLFPAQAAGLLLGVFGVLALMLAVVGLYSVVAYSTTQRTHELAIRIALGAARPQVLKLVLWQGLKFTLMGVSIGIVVALAAARLMTSLLYGVSPNDPLSFVAVAVLLGIVALVASYVPARRAMRVDPLVALKYE
jgi:putative ABC transport system permease protein